jgi:chromosome segregation ATPase
MLKDTRLADLESSNAQYRRQLAEAEDRIASLETRLRETQASLNALQETGRREGGGGQPLVQTDVLPEKSAKLLALRAAALELQNALIRETGASGSVRAEERNR